MGLIPNEISLNLGGDASTPVPVKITVGERVFMLGVGFLIVALIVGVKKKRK
jgi:hypothetical protein